MLIRFLRQINAAQQTPFAGQGMDTEKEFLYAFEVRLSFCLDKFLAHGLPRVVPPHGNLGRILRSIGNLEQAKSCQFNEALVFSRGAEEVKADRTASRNFLLRHHSTDN